MVVTLEVSKSPIAATLHVAMCGRTLLLYPPFEKSGDSKPFMLVIEFVWTSQVATSPYFSIAAAFSVHSRSNAVSSSAWSANA